MTKNEILLIQDSLAGKGFDVGPVDGIYGRRTRAAFTDFKYSIGISMLSTLDSKYLKSKLLENPTKSGSGVPLWLRLALTYDGLREWPGQKHNPKILEWFKAVGHAWVKDDERAWCAAFVGGVLAECSIEGTHKLQARSFLKWGNSLKNPCVGSIVVLWRGKKTGFKGHIGFVVGQDLQGNLMVMGGNQGNQANIRKFKRDRVLGYQWPDWDDLGELTSRATFNNLQELPIYDGKNIKLSTNEA